MIDGILIALILVAGMIVPLTPGYLSEDQQVCNCVAFRLDDVQDKLNTNSQHTIISTFLNEKQSLTLAIVGNSIGRDTSSKQLVDLIKNNKDSLEFASHGFDHEDFSELNEVEQTALLLKSNDSIYRLFGKTPTIFVPPNNVFNDDTDTAMQNAKMTVFSGINANDILYQDTENKITHIPSNVAMSKYDVKSKKWVDIPENEVKKNIESAIKSDGYSVIVLRPNSIDANTSKIKSVLNYVKSLDYRISNLGYISNYYSMQVPPDPKEQDMPIVQEGDTVTNVYNTTNVYQNSTTVTSEPAVLQEQYEQLIASLQELSDTTLASMESLRDIQQTPQGQQQNPPALIPREDVGTNTPPPSGTGNPLSSIGDAFSRIQLPAFPAISDNRSLIVGILALAGVVSIIAIVMAFRRKRRIRNTESTKTKKDDTGRKDSRIPSSDKVDWG